MVLLTEEEKKKQELAHALFGGAGGLGRAGALSVSGWYLSCVYGDTLSALCLRLCVAHLCMMCFRVYCLFWNQTLITL